MGDSPQHSVPQSDSNLDNIFHVLDEDSLGYITVEKFTTALNSFIPNEFPRDKLNLLLDNLDPQSDGRIYLNDFRKAIMRLKLMAEEPIVTLRVSQASNGDAATPTGEESMAVLNGEDPVVEADLAASAELGRSPSHRRAPQHRQQDSVGSWTSSAAVDHLDSAIRQHEDAMMEAGAVGPLDSSGQNWQTAGEESYEDWGSGDLGPGGCLIDFSGSPPPMSSTPGGEVGGGLSVKPPLPPDASQGQLERGSEVRGTWPRHRPRPDSIKLNVPSRSPSLRSPHPSRRPLHRPPSANQLAQHLYSTSSGRSSPRTSGDGMFYDEADFPLDASMFNDEVKTTLKLLNDRIEQLSSSLSMSDSRYNKLVEENQMLRDRLSRQEDDFREAEARLRRKMDEDKARAKAKLAKVTKEKDSETERLIEKLRQVESSLAEHRVEAARTRAEAERLRAESARQEERAEALDTRLGTAREDAERHREVSRRELDGAKRERDQAQALLEELNRELDSWRSGGGPGGGGGRDRAASAAEMLSRYREVELLAKRLTQENKSLREQLEESQAELLTRGLEEGQALLRRHGIGSASLAAELETMTKDELMDLLVREKDGNEKLKSYIDRILLRIMEKQPDLLEVGMLA